MFRIVQAMITQKLLLAALGAASILTVAATTAPAAGAATSADLIEFGCRLQQLPKLPDLVVEGNPMANTITVQNVGCAATPRGGFAVTATEEDGTTTTFAVNQILGIGQSVVLSYPFFCTGDEVRVDADTRNQVIELSELNNRARLNHINC